MCGPPMNLQGSRSIFRFLLVSGLLWSLATGSLRAQEADPRDKPISPSPTTDAHLASPKPSAKDKPPAETKPRARAGAFVIAPLPISSPAVGSGVVPVLAYI